LFLIGLGFILSTLGASAATIVWGGGDLPNLNTNWSDTANWVGAVVPVANSDVKFFNAGAVTVVSNLTDIVDTSMTIGSLQYGNTNNNHTTQIPAGVTLNVTNTGGLFVGTITTLSPSTQVVDATITGAGILSISNLTAFTTINQGASTAATTERSILDLSGLNTFSNTTKAIFVGSTGNNVSGGLVATANGAGVCGTLYLAQTNFISAVFVPGNANYPTNVMATSPGINIGYNGAGSAGGVSYLYLGQSNIFNVDSISVGQTKGLASMNFGPSFINNNPVAVFRGTNGGTTRVSYWAVGDTGTRGGSNKGQGTNDFTGGTLDAMVNLLTLGQDTWAGSGSPGDTASATSLGSYGVFNFPAGKLDVNTLTLGNVQSTYTTTLNNMPCLGVMNVGSNAVLRVNTVLQMTYTALNSPSATSQFTYGNLNVTNATVLANSITVGAYTASVNNRIILTNSTLIVSNALATSANPLTNYYTANSLLGLTITANSATKMFVGNLTTGGTTNVIQLGSTPVFFSSYPAQIPLIKYYGALTGSGFNFGLTNTPNWAVSASLSNNVVNNSIDLVLPSDPRPVISVEPASYSGNPGDNVTFSVTAGGVSPLSYQWRTNGVNISDGPTGNGSTNFGSLTATLGVTNAQPADSVNTPGYAVVITNVYGSVTSSPAVLTISVSAVPPGITGPTNLTVIAGNNLTINDSVTGSPLPAQQWYDQTSSPILGATSSSLTLNNVQYSQNGYAYSLVATNTAGQATNMTTLTVIVAPVITSQPVSLVVTNTQTASFTVAATGVPAPAYQWSKNSVAISSAANNTATNATFTIASASPGDINSYSVTITNQAGITNSVSVNLTVNSTMATTAFAPANGATGVCYDTPLYVTFSAAPVLRNAGTIKIYNVTNSTTPVDTLNLAVNAGNGTQARSAFPGDSQAFNYYPVIITGTTAAIYPHSGVMTSNQTYYVTIDDGVFTDSTGAYFAGITATNVWQFATKVGGPANATNLVVAQDYSGDFATVQGAVDSVPAANTTPRLINIKNGNYVEIVDIAGKNDLVLRGQSRASTIIGYPNNLLIAAGGGSTHARMAFKVDANDIALDNLTITNSTAQDLAQAEALMIETGAARLIVNNCNIDSYQDTVLANTSSSKAYFYKSLVQGDVDFIWGGGNLFFTNCEVRWLIRNANTAALGPNPSPNATTDINSNGFSFVNCALTTLPGANPNDNIGRTRSITNGNTVLIGGFISTNLGGWYPDASPTALYRNWYYGCTNDLGASVTLSNGIALSSTDPSVTNASSSGIWLYGWQPQLAPNILSNPVSQTIGGGQSATFTVVATGISDPVYQWQVNGSPLAGQTATSLTINNANANNIGSYSVIVSNAAGVVTSSNATLTVSNTAPTLTPVSDQTINVGVNLSVANVATDPDVPAQTLAFSLLTGPAASAVDGSGNFTWRPTVSFAGTSNPVQVVVTDNGTPNLSATNSFNVIVNPLTAPATSAPTYAGGQFSVSVSGQSGPDYELQASTNLVGGTWVDVAATNSPASPFTLTDTNAAAQPVQFYRVVTGPPLP
jgi:pectin methylesterase-like acyl-CoA thioesterase